MSVGFAYTETVVVLPDEPNAKRALQRFTFALSAVIARLLLVMALTPLAELWFRNISLPEALITPAVHVLTFGAVWLWSCKAGFRAFVASPQDAALPKQWHWGSGKCTYFVDWCKMGRHSRLVDGHDHMFSAALCKRLAIDPGQRAPAVKPSVGLSVE